MNLTVSISHATVAMLHLFLFQGATVPGQGLLNSIAQFITGPFGKAITLIAIVLCGVIRDDFRRALLFMDTQLADSTLAAWTKGKIIDNFLTSAAPDEEVRVDRIDIEDLRAAPYKAAVEYELIYKSPLDQSEIKRSLYAAHFVFAFRDSVGNDLIQINPLGLAISYFREDEALH